MLLQKAAFFFKGSMAMAVAAINISQAEIVHRLPGRLRLYLPGLARRRLLAGELTGALTMLPGVRQAAANPVSGRVLLHFDPGLDWQLLTRQVETLWTEILSASRPVNPGASGHVPTGKPDGSGQCAVPERPSAGGDSRFAGGGSSPAGGIAALALGGAVIALLGIKQFLQGSSSLAASPALNHVAVAANLLAGYSIVSGKEDAGGSTPARRKLAGLVGLAGLGATLLKESLSGLTLFWLSGAAMVMDSLVRRRYHSSGGTEGTVVPGATNTSSCNSLTGTYVAETSRTAFSLSALTGLFTARPSRSLAMLVAGNPAGARKSLHMTGAALSVKADRLGIKVPHARFLEQLSDVDTVLFADAGLFLMPWRLGKVMTQPGVRPRDVIHTAIALAGKAGHPLAALFPARLEKQEVIAESSGPLELKGRIGLDRAFVGPLDINGDVADPWMQLKGKQLTHLGQVPLGVVRQGRFLGIIGVYCLPRPGMEEVITALRSSGVQHIIVSTSDRTLGTLLEGMGLEAVDGQQLQERLSAIDTAGQRLARVSSGAGGWLKMQLWPGQEIMIIPGGHPQKLALAFQLGRALAVQVQKNIHFMRIANYLGLFLAATGRISLFASLLYYDLVNILLALGAYGGLLSRRGEGAAGPASGNGGDAPDDRQRGTRSKQPVFRLISGSGHWKPEPVEISGKITQTEGLQSAPGRRQSNAAAGSPDKRPFNGNGWAILTAEEALTYLQSDARRGLDGSEAVRRLAFYGHNRLPEGQPPGFWFRFTAQLQNLMVKTLMGSSVVCLFLGEVGDALAIISIVVLNAIFGVLQEQKAETAVAALRKMSAATARVIRDGQPVELPAAELVPGDLVLLEQGDGVPADIRLLSVQELSMEESALTGESLPVPKHTAAQADCQLLHECRNMVFMGTTVSRGKAIGVVVATAGDTELGKIAGLLQHEEEETPLQKRLAVVSRKVLIACVAVSGLVFLAGILRGERPFNMFLTGVSLAVAAIPEGLPAMVTVAMAAGVWRMSKKRAIVRRLSGVETLGSVTVICSDKTGTLTRNEQTVRSVYAAGKLYRITGTGYDREGELFFHDKRVTAGAGTTLERLFRGAVLCSDARLLPGEKKNAFKVWGDPLEGAILICAGKAGIDLEKLRRKSPRTWETPFDPERGRMTVICQEEAPTLYTKGAPETVLDLCDRVWLDDGPVFLDEARRGTILAMNRSMARQALRVLAVAFLPGVVQADGLDEQEGLIFLGLLGMMDPLREEAGTAVETCRQAGVRLLMITGDQPQTARAVAGELGLVKEADRVISGREIEKLSDSELIQLVEEVNVFARVLPRHKLRLVKALRNKGHVVAMIGDGANDAPAVKKAHIGIAMGRSGTHVTREASSIIIADDNFATVVEAIAEGRGVYAGIRRSVRYQLATNAGEVLLMFLAVALGRPLPMAPIQLLWLNILGDGLPAMALGTDRPAPEVMKHPPQPANARFFDREYTGLILSRGAAIGLSAFGAYLLSLRAGRNLTAARTVVLGTLTISQLLYAVQCRRNAATQPNSFLTGSITLSGALLLGAFYLPGLRSFLKTGAPGYFDWLVMGLGVGLSVVLDRLICTIGKGSLPPGGRYCIPAAAIPGRPGL
jgi:Ca2+-transporting ATPase